VYSWYGQHAKSEEAFVVVVVVVKKSEEEFVVAGKTTSREISRFCWQKFSQEKNRQ
jgi:hypothetical protein